MNTIGRLNVNHMIYLLTVKENDFNPAHAALDLGVCHNGVAKVMKNMEENIGFLIFTRGKRKHHPNGDAFVGFTDKGQELYFSIKTFIDSIMLIGEEDENNNN